MYIGRTPFKNQGLHAPCLWLFKWCMWNGIRIKLYYLQGDEYHQEYTNILLIDSVHLTKKQKGVDLLWRWVVVYQCAHRRRLLCGPSSPGERPWVAWPDITLPRRDRLLARVCPAFGGSKGFSVWFSSGGCWDFLLEQLWPNSPQAKQQTASVERKTRSWHPRRNWFGQGGWHWVWWGFGNERTIWKRDFFLRPRGRSWMGKVLDRSRKCGE